MGCGSTRPAVVTATEAKVHANDLWPYDQPTPPRGGEPSPSNGEAPPPPEPEAEEASGELKTVRAEIFQWSDCVMPVTKEKPKKPATFGHQKTRKSAKKMDQEKSEPTFQFGDFCITMESALDDAIIQAAPGRPAADSNASFSPGRCITECPIRNFHQYTLLGHATRVKCATLSPTEQHFVSCAHEDTAIVMYDVYSGREKLSFFGHEDTVISACFSLDSKYLATTSRDNTMILWDAVIGQQVSVFDHEKVVLCCCFSRDGKYLVSGCQDKICRKWDVRRRREVLMYAEHEGIIVALSYAPDGQYVCSAAADKTLHIWSANTGQTMRVLRGHKGIVLACTYALDGRSVVSNDESTVMLWDTESGACTLALDVTRVVQPNPKSTTKKVAWTLSTYAPGQFGFYVVAVCNDRAVLIIHPLTGKEILSFQTKAPVYCLSSGATQKLAFGDSYGNIYIVVLA